MDFMQGNLHKENGKLRVEIDSKTEIINQHVKSMYEDQTTINR